VGPQIIFGFLVFGFWFLAFGFLIVSYPGLSSAVPRPECHFGRRAERRAQAVGCAVGRAVGRRAATGWRSGVLPQRGRSTASTSPRVISQCWPPEFSQYSLQQTVIATRIPLRLLNYTSENENGRPLHIAWKWG